VTPATNPERETSAVLGRRELALVFAFWTFFAVLTAANRALDPRGQGFRSTVSWAWVLLAFVESYLWALLTPLIFWMASRFSVREGSRTASVLLYLLAGVAIALLLDAIMDVLRGAVLPPLRPPGRGRLGPPRGGGGPFGTLRRLWVLNDLVIYMGVLAAGLARDFSLRYRARQQDAARLSAEAARLEAQLAEARLDALRRQLDPHFLFNTLNAISSLVERDPRGVRRMISRLGELLRHSIEGGTAQEIPLERELELLERYIDIMRIRFQGRLEVETHTEPLAREALVPNLILQPIVENAIKHGVSKVEGTGRIDISAAREGEELVVRVRDNGPGLGRAAEPFESRDGEGVGHRNTVARLGELYGDAWHFSLSPGESGGAVAELRIPYHTAAELRAGVPSAAGGAS
jgi:two-component sensor histidine kinase